VAVCNTVRDRAGSPDWGKYLGIAPNLGDYIMIKLTMAAAAAAMLLVAPVAASAQVTEPVSFTLNNETDHILVSLYISVPSTDEWEEDIFGDGMLDAGDSVEVTIDDNLSDCEYDLKAEFSDGTELALGSVDFCELDGGSIDVSE